MNDNTTNTTTPAAEPRKGFVFFLSWADCLQDLRPTERAAVYDAVVQYAKTGEMPELKGRCKMALAFILKDFDRQDEKYQRIIEKRRAAGRMGGAPKGNINAAKTSKNNQKQAKTSKTSIEEEEEAEAEVEAEVEEEAEDVKLVRAQSAACAATNEQRKVLFFESVKAYMGTYPAEMLRHFATYWSEPTPDGHRMRYELERTWSLPHRLRAWQSREPMKARASPTAAAQQREQEARERERQYQQRMAREEAERERKLAEQRAGAITYEEYLARKKARC